MAMNRAILLFLPCLLSMGIMEGSAQDNRSFKVGLSYVDFVSSGQKGLGFCTEYNVKISKHITVSPSVHLMYATGEGEYPYYLFDRSATGADLNVFITPISFGKSRMRFGIGPSARYITGYSIKDFVIADRASIGIGGNYSVPFFHPARRLDNPNHLTLGCNVTAETELNLSSQWLLSLRVSHQSYFSRDAILSLGIGGGYRF